MGVNETTESLKELYPCCYESNKGLFDEVAHHILIMQEVSCKMGVPLEELIEFFYKGKLKLDCINEQEEVLKQYGR